MAKSVLKIAKTEAEKQEWKLCGAERRAAVISAAVPRVMSRLLRGYVRLWAGYVLLPLAAKLRCARCARTFLWGSATVETGQGIQPLSHRWFLIKDIKALVCPFAVLRSRFGLRYSCVRGRRQSKFLASSSTGGARNFYPCTGEPRFTLN